jgi:Mg2+ and Co2+ transporter CorA
MIDNIELFIYGTVTICIAILAYSYFNIFLKYKKVVTFLAQSELEREYFRAKLSEYAEHKESKNVEKTEGFIRFISQSRDWAFKYIEDVQKDLESLKEIFYNTGSMPSDLNQAKELNNRVAKVLSHLPKEDK